MIRRVVAAGVLVLATGAFVPVAAAAPKAGCDDGVSVVVEPGELGGDTRTACVDGGDDESAAALFEDAGFHLAYQPQMQDFVCTIDGQPADRDCTGADAYWSLWWSDGEHDWAYSTLGVRSLEVPAGGAVAFAWHEGEDEAAPPTTPVGDASSGSVASRPAPLAEDDGSFPVWAGVLVAVLVLGAAAAVPLLRRRR